MNRRQILDRLDELHQTKCEVCPAWEEKPSPTQCVSCATYEEIRTLGDALLENPRRPKKIRSLLDKGADMNDTDTEILVGLRVKKGVIRKAMIRKPMSISR